MTADQVPTREEVVAIIAAAPLPFRAGIALGATGLRVGEVMGVTLGRLDLPALRPDRVHQVIDALTATVTLAVLVGVE